MILAGRFYFVPLEVVTYLYRALRFFCYLGSVRILTL